MTHFSHAWLKTPAVLNTKIHDFKFNFYINNAKRKKNRLLLKLFSFFFAGFSYKKNLCSFVFFLNKRSSAATLPTTALSISVNQLSNCKKEKTNSLIKKKKERKKEIRSQWHTCAEHIHNNNNCLFNIKRPKL